MALPKPPATTSFSWKLTDTAGKNLNGATFTLSGGEAPLTVTSQDAADPGVYSASNLDPAKTYTLTETTAPSGYKADTASYTLTFVAKGDTYQPQINGKPLADQGLVIKNVKLPTKAEIRWEVVSSADAKQYVPGTSFKVTAFKADGQNLDTTKSFIVSDATAIAGDRDLNPNLGQYRVEVPDGSLKYQVEQLTAGADFVPKTGAQVVTFKLQTDGRYSQIVDLGGLKFENTPVIKTAQFTWKLVDKDSKPLAGGSFALKDGSETVPVTENKADASFQATLNQAKTYKLQQTAAPEGYDKDTKIYTISFENGKAQVSVDDTGVDLTEGTLVISNNKQATDPTPDPTDEPTPDPKPVLTWKVLDGKGQPVAGTSFQVTPLGKDGKPAAAAFEVTDFVSGTTTFAVRTDQDPATGAYRVQVSDVSLQYQLKQLTTAKGLQLAAEQTLSFSKGTDGKWSQTAAKPFVNLAGSEDKPTPDPTDEPSTKPSDEPTSQPTAPSTDPTADPQPGDNSGAATKPSAGQNGGAVEAPAGAYMTGGSNASGTSAGPAPSSLRITGANGATLALISAILALAGAGVLTARKLRQDR